MDMQTQSFVIHCISKSSYLKNPKISDTRKIVLNILKLEQCDFNIEYCNDPKFLDRQV